MAATKKLKSCPSSTCHTGAILLGKVAKDGSVGFLAHKMELDDEAVKEFHKLVEPEKYYRFSCNCVESGCNQWKSGNCTVIQRVLHAEVEAPLPETLPKCLIKPTCRWYYQEGDAACRICPYIITDLTEIDMAYK